MLIDVVDESRLGLTSGVAGGRLGWTVFEKYWIWGTQSVGGLADTVEGLSNGEAREREMRILTDMASICSNAITIA